jgi:hypothetical protein
MPDWTLVNRAHVLAALAEYDQVGSRDFLSRYRFGRSRVSTLWHDGQEYDPKAVLGVAYLHATGRAATSEEFSEGETGAVRVLQGLGFDVVVDQQELDAEERRERARPARTARTATAAPSRATKAPATPRARKAPAPLRRKPAEIPPKICPTCYTALPATGVCDFCD